MKISAKSNIFEVTVSGARSVYADFLRGTGNEPVLVVAQGNLADGARDALEKTTERLGYGKSACCWLTCALPDGVALGPQDLFTLIESIDPICCIVTDGEANALFAQAYHQAPVRDDVHRVLGRTCVSFGDFSAMLASSEGKQKAWALLKKLPHFDAR